MRFKLVNDILSEKLDIEDAKEYFDNEITNIKSGKSKNKGNLESQEKIAQTAVKQIPNYNSIKDIANIVADSFVTDGTDEDNKFLDYISNLNDSIINNKNHDKISYIKTLFEKGYTDLGEDKKLLYDKQLFEVKDFEDFRYIANAYSLFTNPQTQKQYFRNLSSEDNVDNIFYKDGVLKSKKDIYNTFEVLSKTKGNNTDMTFAEYIDFESGTPIDKTELDDKLDGIEDNYWNRTDAIQQKLKKNIFNGKDSFLDTIVDGLNNRNNELYDLLNKKTILDSDDSFDRNMARLLNAIAKIRGGK